MTGLHSSILAAAMLASAQSLGADGIQLAQYRADVDDVSWRVGTEMDAQGFSDGVTEPWGLSEYGAAGSLDYGVRLGPYRLSGLFEIYRLESFTADRPYDAESIVSFAPGVSWTPNSVTRLFHSLRLDQNVSEVQADRWGGDSSSERTGLTQTWFFARQRAHITLGYGFEQGDTDDLYSDMRSHSLVLSSRFPLFWGLSARIQADYARNSYQGYQGASEVESYRQMFRASLDHSLTDRLYGELQFSYLDEDFDDPDLSYRRYVWGLNLRYRY